MKNVPHVDVLTLLSIDAWKDPDGGWFWNDMLKLEEDIWVPEDSSLHTSNRSLLKYFRENLGVLNDYSKGRVAIDRNDDIMDGVLWVVCSKNTGQPIFALSSIH